MDAHVTGNGNAMYVENGITVYASELSVNDYRYSRIIEAI